MHLQDCIQYNKDRRYFIRKLYLLLHRKYNHNIQNDEQKLRRKNNISYNIHYLSIFYIYLFSYQHRNHLNIFNNVIHLHLWHRININNLTVIFSNPFYIPKFLNHSYKECIQYYITNISITLIFDKLNNQH